MTIAGAGARAPGNLSSKNDLARFFNVRNPDNETGRLRGCGSRRGVTRLRSTSSVPPSWQLGRAGLTATDLRAHPAPRCSRCRRWRDDDPASAVAYARDASELARSAGCRSSTWWRTRFDRDRHAALRRRSPQAPRPGARREPVRGAAQGEPGQHARRAQRADDDGTRASPESPSTAPASRSRSGEPPSARRSGHPPSGGRRRPPVRPSAAPGSAVGGPPAGRRRPPVHGRGVDLSQGLKLDQRDPACHRHGCRLRGRCGREPSASAPAAP